MFRYFDKKFNKRFLAVILAFCFMLVALPVNNGTVKAEEIEQNGVLTDYNAEIVSGNRTLYINPFNGNFAVTDTTTGYVWYSTPENIDDVDMKNSKKNYARSALFLTVYDNDAKKGTNTVTSQSGSVRDNPPTITVKGDTAKIVYIFEEYGFTVPLNITLTKYGFSAWVDTKEIKEENKQFSLIAVSILPNFNAGYFEENGFMLVPDGSGAVINFNNGRGDYSEYSQSVYSRDYALSKLYDTNKEKSANMPFFGMAKEGDYSIGFIKSGASVATVKATGDTYNNLYNNCYADFTLRGMDYYRNEGKWQDVEVYQKGKLPQIELRVDYILAENPTPDYSVMAKNLREYLISEYSLKNFDSAPLQLDIVGSTVKKRMFLGIPVYGVQRLTDFSDSIDIVEELYSKKLDKITLVYKNWSQNTVKQKMTPSASVSLLGGKKKYQKLKKLLNDKNGSLYLEINPFYVKSGKGLFSQFTDYAHDIFNSTVEIYPNHLNTYARNTNEKAGFFVKNSLIQKQIESWNKKVAKLGVDGILYSGTDMLHSDLRDEGSSRYDFEANVSKALAKAKMPVMSDGGNFYTAVYSQYISGLTMTSMGFDIEDYSIPFVQMVLHGVRGYSGEPINSQANYIEAFLRTVETGSALRFIFATDKTEQLEDSKDSHLIYSSFERWKDDVVKMYSAYSKFYNQVSKETVVTHKKLQENVYLTEYSNGNYSVVNYGDSAVSSAYGEIEAKSFITGEN